MGRPRKRTRLAEPARERNVQLADSFDDDFACLPDSTAMPYMRHVTCGLETPPFLSFDDSYLTGNVASPMAITGYTTAKQTEGLITATDPGWPVWRFGNHDYLKPIDFGLPQPEKVLDNSLFQLPTPESEVNYLTTASCSCLASLYLALASVQELSPDISAALRTVRGASVTTLSVLRCPVCGSFDTSHVGLPVRAFQSMMLVGTLLPIIADRYRQLLDIIERETAAAQAAGRRQDFTIEAYGGVGMMMCGEAARCCASDFLKTHDLEPLEWRTAVRALLRADVYGINAENTGLKGLVVELEERQEERHRHLDVMLEACLPGEQRDMISKAKESRLCKTITEQAKSAIDALVIP